MISVCLPYWDRQDALDRMFENYAEMYPCKIPGVDLEFSICNDGWHPVSHPSGRAVTVTHLPRKDHPLNPCVPINRAVEASSGDIIVLTGPEIEHTEPTLYALAELLEDEDDYVMASCWDLRGFWLAGSEVDYSTRGRLPVPPGGHFHFCTMFHRSLWEKAGGFDEDYRHGQGCDDNDWLWRLHRAGARFKLSASTVIHHRSSFLDWQLPHNRDLFFSKWPEARQLAGR